MKVVREHESKTSHTAKPVSIALTFVAHRARMRSQGLEDFCKKTIKTLTQSVKLEQTTKGVSDNRCCCTKPPSEP
eukprot:2213878-Amphidinium_carterae.1